MSRKIRITRSSGCFDIIFPKNPLGTSGGFPQLRRRDALPTERVVRGAMDREVFQALFRLFHRGYVAGVDPPHRDVRALHLGEPLLTLAVEALVHGLPHKALERLDAFPHRQVHGHVRIRERPDGGRVVALVLEAPHEPGRTLGDAVDEVEVVHEAGHARIVGRIAQAADVERSEMLRFGHYPLPPQRHATNTSNAPVIKTPSAMSTRSKK